MGSIEVSLERDVNDKGKKVWENKGKGMCRQKKTKEIHRRVGCDIANNIVRNLNNFTDHRCKGRQGCVHS